MESRSSTVCYRSLVGFEINEITTIVHALVAKRCLNITEGFADCLIESLSGSRIGIIKGPPALAMA